MAYIENSFVHRFSLFNLAGAENLQIQIFKGHLDTSKTFPEDFLFENCMQMNILE